MPVLLDYPVALKNNRMTIFQIERIIQEKIIQRTKRANDQYREAYALFGSPANGISRSDFKRHLQKLGLVVSDQEVAALFDRYDSDGSGHISFQELVNWVMPKVRVGQEGVTTLNTRLRRLLGVCVSLLNPKPLFFVCCVHYLTGLHTPIMERGP